MTDQTSRSASVEPLDLGKVIDDVLDHAEVIGNVTAALLDLNVTYDGSRATFTFESTNNAMRYIHKARAIVEERLALIRSYRHREAG